MSNAPFSVDESFMGCAPNGPDQRLRAVDRQHEIEASLRSSLRSVVSGGVLIDGLQNGLSLPVSLTKSSPLAFKANPARELMPNGILDPDIIDGLFGYSIPPKERANADRIAFLRLKDFKPIFVGPFSQDRTVSFPPPNKGAQNCGDKGGRNAAVADNLVSRHAVHTRKH